MKLIWITAPAGMALACLGLLLTHLANEPHYSTQEIKTGEPRHLVTERMLAETSALANKREPVIHTQDITGHEIVLADRKAARPQYIYFVNDGCPCSFDAEPLFHDLYKNFKGVVDFVSITNGDLDKAKQWNAEIGVPYPVISDHREEIIHAYGAKASVYSVLVTKEGYVAKMWPGYSADLLKDINATIAKLAGVAEKPFDTKYAPEKKATGCAFTNPEIK